MSRCNYRDGSHVAAKRDTNVRSGPSIYYNIRHTVPEGQTGTVIGGPQWSDDEYTWCQVEYDSGAQGWSVERNLNVA